VCTCVYVRVCVCVHVLHHRCRKLSWGRKICWVTLSFANTYTYSLSLSLFLSFSLSLFTCFFLFLSPDPDLLPMTFSFRADLDGNGDELLLRDPQHASNHKDFKLPSSRATIYDSQFGWILCRNKCPVILVTEVRDIYQTLTRWTTTLHLNRPGCPDKIAPCVDAVMLDVIDKALKTVNVFAADLQPVNALMLLLAVELADLDLFSINGTMGASSTATTMRTNTPGQVWPHIF